METLYFNRTDVKNTALADSFIDISFQQQSSNSEKYKVGATNPLLLGRSNSITCDLEKKHFKKEGIKRTNSLPSQLKEECNEKRVVVRRKIKRLKPISTDSETMFFDDKLIQLSQIIESTTEIGTNDASKTYKECIRSFVETFIDPNFVNVKIPSNNFFDFTYAIIMLTLIGNLQNNEVPEVQIVNLVRKITEIKSISTINNLKLFVNPLLQEYQLKLNEHFFRILLNWFEDPNVVQKILSLAEPLQTILNEQSENLEKKVEFTVGECPICLSTHQVLITKNCCQKSSCVLCLHKWLVTLITERRIMKSGCLHCDKPFSHIEIETLANTDITNYKQMLYDLTNNKAEKTCPNCHHIMKKPSTKSRNKQLVTCDRCDYVWCFKCHGPQHDGISCRKNKKNDRKFREWVHQNQNNGNNVRNAQKCANIFCGAYIQKTDGCNHMTCGNCGCEFCYLCGKTYFLSKLHIFGKHEGNRFGIAGCKKAFLESKPVLRKLIRGSLFVTEICVGVPLVVTLAGVIVGLLLSVSPILVTGFGIYALRKKLKYR